MTVVGTRTETATALEVGVIPVDAILGDDTVVEVGITPRLASPAVICQPGPAKIA